jgi:hypothetical protein
MLTEQQLTAIREHVDSEQCPAIEWANLRALLAHIDEQAARLRAVEAEQARLAELVRTAWLANDHLVKHNRALRAALAGYLPPQAQPRPHAS